MSDLVADVRDAKRLPDAELARAIRKTSGATQQQVADEVGVHRVTLARYERGEPISSVKLRARYARVLAQLQQGLAS